MKRTSVPTSKKMLLLLTSTLLLAASPAPAFQQQGPGSAGCAAGDCRDCHSLDRKEAAALLKPFNIAEKDIVSINLSEVPGLWAVEVLQHGRTVPLMVDFSKEFVIPNQAFRVVPPKDPAKASPSQPKTVNVAQIPVDDALLIGKATATRKIIVFDDPECPFCAALQPEMQTVVKGNPDVAFLIKLFPLTRIHPTAYEKARAIACAKSVTMLEDSLAGKPVPPPVCDTDQIRRNMELARTLGIFSTPTMILPDGRISPGLPAEDIIRVLNGEEPQGGLKRPEPVPAVPKAEAPGVPKAESAGVPKAAGGKGDARAVGGKGDAKAKAAAKDKSK